MKNTYLLASIIGFIAPNIFAVKESIETGNILLWRRPLDTFQGMFANNISTAFSIDLLLVVLVFLLWSYHESKKLQISGWGLLVGLTMFLGMSGTFPLFLYWRQQKLERVGK